MSDAEIALSGAESAAASAATASMAAQTAVNAATSGVGSSSLIVVSGGTIDLDNAKGDGYLIGYDVTASTTIEGTSYAPGVYVFRRHSPTYGGWRVATISEGVQVVPSPDSVAPTAGTLAATVGETTANLSVSGALDETALHAAPYSFRYSSDAGVTWSAWTAWQAGTTYAYTGLTASTSGTPSVYRFAHRVRDAVGNIKEGLAVDRTMSTVLTWTTHSSENFTGVADGVLLNGMTPDVGSALAVYDGKVNVTTGATSAQAKVISEAAGCTAASGAFQAAYSIIWTGISTATKALRFTANHDLSGATTGAYVALRVALNGGFTNYLTVGVKSDGTVYFDRFGGAVPTITTVGSPPTINRIGKVTVVMTGTHALADWIVKVYINDVLHTTYTMSGSFIYADKAVLIHDTSALGTNVSRINDFVLEKAL